MTSSASPSTRATPTTSSAQTPAVAPAPTPATAGSGGGTPPGGAMQQAFIDPKTGKLRPAEHDDALGAPGGSTAAKRAGRAATEAAAAQELTGPDGAVGALVPDELQTYTVATVTPDGRVAIDHATGPTQAAAMVRQAASGRLKIATDVFPEEPVPAGDPVRRVEGMLLSAHRTGGMPDALYEIGRMAVGDAELILQGLAPVLSRRAQRETVGRMRSKPVSIT